MTAAMFWFVLALIVGVAANTRGRSSLGWFALAVIMSPLLAGLLVLALPRIQNPDEPSISQSDEQFEGMASWQPGSKQPFSITSPQIPGWQKGLNIVVVLLVVLLVASFFYTASDKPAPQQPEIKAAASLIATDVPIPRSRPKK